MPFTCFGIRLPRRQVFTHTRVDSWQGHPHLHSARCVDSMHTCLLCGFMMQPSATINVAIARQNMSILFLRQQHSQRQPDLCTRMDRRTPEWSKEMVFPAECWQHF